MRRFDKKHIIESANNRLNQEFIDSKKTNVNEWHDATLALATMTGLILSAEVLNTAYHWGKNEILKRVIVPTGERKEMISKRGIKTPLIQYSDKRNGELYWGINYREKIDGGAIQGDGKNYNNSIVLWKDNPEKIEKIIRQYEGDDDNGGDDFPSDMTIGMPRSA